MILEILLLKQKKTKMKKKTVCKNAANLYNELLTIYFNDYRYVINKKRRDRYKI